MLIIISANNTFKYERVKRTLRGWGEEMPSRGWQEASRGGLKDAGMMRLGVCCTEVDGPFARAYARAFLLVNWSSRPTMAYHGSTMAAAVLYSGRCSVALFFVSRATARSFETRPSFSAQAKGPPTVSKVHSVLRAAKRNFVPSRGNFHCSERATLSTRERKRKKEKESR